MKNNFNLIAFCYDPLSRLVFGNSLRRSQIILLDHLRGGQKLLILGGGTGWILKEIQKRYTNIHIDYVELSGKMIRKAKRKNNLHATPVNFLQADVRELQAENLYDCVIAFYFFDLFELASLQQVISFVHKSLKPEGKLLMADFEWSDTIKWKHKILMKIMYIFFKITASLEASSIGPFRELLPKENFKLIFRSTSMQGFLSSEVYQK
ncbi:MAG TPA: class I SAM-dependent methyltransferase [Cytophagaceae bacterium]|nr:class I SAM-dependent methyltransferase [Cytophagaceae bacterium]